MPAPAYNQTVFSGFCKPYRGKNVNTAYIVFLAVLTRCGGRLLCGSAVPDTHSEAAGVSRASSQAEVCGPACLTAPRKQVLQHRQRRSAALPGRQGKVFSSVSGGEVLLTRGFEFTTLFHQNSIITGKKKPPCGIDPARWYVLLQIGIYFFKSHTHYFFLSAAA